MGLKIGAGSASQSATEGVWANVYHDPTTGYTWWLDSEPALSPDGKADARIRVARAGNPDARKFARKMSRKYRHLARRGGGDLPDHIVMKNLREQFATTVLMDWERVQFPDGSTPDYSPEKGVEAFEADEEFLDTVIDIANTAEAFREDALQEDAEDLGNASGGKSDGGHTSESSAKQESS